MLRSVSAARSITSTIADVGTKLPLAHQIQQVLQAVRQLVDRGESEKPGGTLDGMDAAADRVHEVDFDVGAAGLDRQRLLLDVGQMFGRFDDELAEDFLIPQ